MNVNIKKMNVESPKLFASPVVKPILGKKHNDAIHKILGQSMLTNSQRINVPKNVVKKAIASPFNPPNGGMNLPKITKATQTLIIIALNM